MENLLRASLVTLLIFTLSACGGWSLRGTRAGAVSVESVYVRAAGARRLKLALYTELANSGITRVIRESQAAAVIDLSDESFDRRVLSVDPDTGKVREIELGLEVRLSIRGSDGKLLVPPEKLSWVQDFVFDETSLLGTVERSDLVERELAEDAARAIRLRLETINFEPR